MNFVLHVAAILALLWLANFARSTLGIEVLAVALVFLAAFFAISIFDAAHDDKEWWDNR